ncbi:MAG: hypothetical protein ABI323_04005, partial [Solirubrobacteraceae bacterium]
RRPPARATRALGAGYVPGMEPAPLKQSAGADQISRGLVLLLAVACGAAAVNLYYAQPLLGTLGHALGVSNGTAGLLVTVTQVVTWSASLCWSRSGTYGSAVVSSAAR